MNLSLLFAKLGISASLSQDITLFFVIALVSFVFWMFIGRYKIITVLINIYVSLAIMSAVPEKYFTDYTFKLILFYALVVALTIVSKKLFEIYISGSGSGFLWRVFAMSFLEVMMLLSITLVLVPKKVALGYVSPTSYDYLTADMARLLWMVLPLILMFAIHKRLNR
jgi:hypothetical protein